ncbi:hypothetical protein OV450_1405 [Actinobacteria bacterium OV450]|nr:hypothetical protein OV450_1405 [Actinobacteria bacterium OV450]
MRDHPALSFPQSLLASPPCPPSFSSAGSQLTQAARAFAALTDPGDRNAEILQLGQQAGLVLTHGADDLDPHFANPEGSTTQCGQEVTRWLSDELAARVSILCTACEHAATALRDGPAEAPQDLIRVHHFDSTAAVREAANRDEIADEDVIVVPSEDVVGFVVVAYAVAITKSSGSLPHLPRPARDYAGGSYLDSVLIAEREARALGLPLRDVPPAADHTHLATRPYAGPATA